MFQCLVDFQDLCKALCHFIIKFIFGKPVRKRKNGFRTLSPAWYPFFIEFLAQASPAYAANHLLRTQQTARLQTQPLSPNDNKWRFISSANPSPKLLLLSPTVVGEHTLPFHPCWALGFHRRQGPTESKGPMLASLISCSLYNPLNTKDSLLLNSVWWRPRKACQMHINMWPSLCPLWRTQVLRLKVPVVSQLFLKAESDLGKAERVRSSWL